MDSAVIGFLGVAAGALIAGLVALMTTRQEHAHRRTLAREERSAALAAEHRSQRRDAYLALSAEMTRALGAIGQRRFSPPMGVIRGITESDSWFQTIGHARAVGSDEVADLLRQFGKLGMRLERGASGTWGDDEVAMHLLDAMGETCDAVIAQVNKELTSFADFSRTEAV